MVTTPGGYGVRGFSHHPKNQETTSVDLKNRPHVLQEFSYQINITTLPLGFISWLCDTGVLQGIQIEDEKVWGNIVEVTYGAR